jgi:hypothetical protein
MEEKPARIPKIHEHAETKSHHPRSLPEKKSYGLAVFFSVIHYLGVIATTTALVIIFLEPSPLAVPFILGGLSFNTVTWLVAYLKRRATFCPLCKGTPLANSGARTHRQAVRVFPFTHGTTAVLSILATHQFRCMYCGLDFDLLKTPSRRLPGAKAAEAAANKAP